MVAYTYLYCIVLHSNDLVNWSLVNYALPVQEPETFFDKAQHGKGVWAPAIRFHNGEFYIYWGDPDYGIYMIKTKDPKGKWSKPVLVKAGKGMIDATPLWDEDGKVYLIHAYAGSRSGRGDPMDKVREFSEIELLIIERIMIVCVNLLREPWENVADIHPRLERIETNSQYAQIISPSEMIAIVTINLKIGEVEGLMNVCLPYLTLEDVIDKLNTKYWYSNLQNQDNTDYTESIETLIRRAQIPIKAVLGNSMISVNDFAMLQPGDIIRLDRKVEDELDIYVGNIRKFTALPGSSGDKYAVRVTSVIREEQ